MKKFRRTKSRVWKLILLVSVAAASEALVLLLILPTGFAAAICPHLASFLGYLGVPYSAVIAGIIIPEVFVHIVSLVTVVLTYDWIFGARKAQNVLRCTECNYVLRGLKTPKCPECGTAIPEEQWKLLQGLQQYYKSS